MCGLFDSLGNESRLRMIERKLDLIISALGIQEPDRSALDAELRELTRTGRKIPAIKLYRERTGADLAEAKSYVDALK